LPGDGDQIAETLGDTELVRIKGTFTPAKHYKRIGFALPCYARGALKPVLRFISTLPLTAKSSDYVFAVVTYNKSGGDAARMVDKALQKKGLRVNYNKGIQMVGNYAVLYPPPSAEKQEKLLNAADIALAKAAEDIASLTAAASLKFNILNAVFNKIGNAFFTSKEKKFKATDACVGCGECTKLCPVGNIEIQNSKPVFLHKNCTNCLACFHWCSKMSIDCGGDTLSKPRYHHPQVTARELE
jgi:ferredoxin